MTLHFIVVCKWATNYLKHVKPRLRRLYCAAKNNTELGTCLSCLTKVKGTNEHIFQNQFYINII